MKIVFLHVPKTGGMSIAEALQKVTPVERFFHGRERAPLTPVEAKDFDVVCGHYTWRQVYAYRRFKVVTVLRDPVEREVSFLNWIDTNISHGHESTIDFEAQQKIALKSIDRYIETFCRDGKMIDIFNIGNGLLEPACAVIESLALCGFTDRMDSIQEKLSELMGKEIKIPKINVSEPRFILTEEQRRKMRERLRNDCALYDHARKVWA